MSNDYQTRDNDQQSSGSGMGLPDVYFVLFRRKWLVFLGLVLGIFAASAVWKLRQPLFQSQAKLLVKYVLENRSPAVLGPEASIQTPDLSGGSVINSEVEILTSLDIAREVAASVTPEKIIPNLRSDVDPAVAPAWAAAAILKNLHVDPPHGRIITLRFEHRDPDTAQLVLEKLIDAYLRKHREIHRASGSMDDVLIQQRDQLRRQLGEAEDQLKVLKEKAGVISLEEAKKTQAQQIATIHQELFKAEAQLALHRASLGDLPKSRPTNGGAILAAEPVPQVIMDEYRRAATQVDDLERRERELLLTVTLENPRAKTNHLNLEAARSLKAKLEKDYPDLVRVTSPQAPVAPGIPTVAITDPATLVRGLEAQVVFLSNQLASVRAEAHAVEEVEGAITDLQRKKTLFETQYLYVERSLQQAKFDRDLGSDRGDNISRVQAPSPAFRDFKELYKKMAMALMGGLGAGIALAFIVEMFLDRTLKRSKDIETSLHVPLFLSIPVLRLSGGRRAALTNGTSEAAAPAKSKHVINGLEDDSKGVAVALKERENGLKPFHDSLRDRLVNYFDIRQMTHKPKLIAVTSCAAGAGVSSVATGLAASLSETGDGNVLLVDMRGERGAAHAFYQGKPSCGLAEALENETRTSAQVQENLFVVSADSVDQELQRIVPRQFSNMVPKLKASDYDYIIFDMPPVAQTTITAKVARFMDMVLMVIESNKTDRDVARRAGSLLAESKATVATILNKHKSYVPAWLHQDFH